MSQNLMKASNEWSSRPDDQRFVGLYPLKDQLQEWDAKARSMVLSTRQVEVMPVPDDEYKGLAIRVEPRGRFTKGLEKALVSTPTHWSFGQLCALADVSAREMRKGHPSPMVADWINYGLKVNRDAKDVGVLVRETDDAVTMAVTGPGYGRVKNLDVTKALIKRFGDGLTGSFRVPGEFGRAVVVNKANTTIYASDRDMFVFLADETNRIEMPGRRAGKSGTFARGFFVWNSEVGAQTLGVATFLFDYVCCNRIVWGPEEYREIRIRHTSKAPDRFVEEITPALSEYANSSTASITNAMENARMQKIGRKDKVEEFLAKRFTKSQVASIQQSHQDEEGSPIETIWDAVVGTTAFAKSIPHQDERVKLEREAGKILDLAL